jgi:ABC-type transport system substrate-binding protein
VVEKWDGFFDQESYLLGVVEWLNLNKIEAAQNGLLDDIVDLAATNPRDLEDLISQGNFEGVVTNNQGHYMLAVCSSKPPFDNAKFREAFDLAINRTRISENGFGGKNEPMGSLWNPGSPLEIPGLINPDGDIDAAKAILADIGWDSDTEITLGIYPGFQTHELIAELVSGSVIDAGLNAKVTIMEGYDVASFSGQGGLHVVANINEGVNAVAIPARGASLAWNPCGLEDPKLNALLDILSAGGSDADLAPTWAEVQNYVIDNHLWYVLNTQPAVYAYNADRIGGLQEGTIGLTGATAPSPFLEGVYVKAS